MILGILARWRTRRELAAMAVALQAENERLRSENQRLTKSLENIGRKALNAAGTAGSHYTPKEFDPACGTGGFLAGGTP
jgi:hypothetical protein